MNETHHPLLETPSTQSLEHGTQGYSWYKLREISLPPNRSHFFRSIFRSYTCMCYMTIRALWMTCQNSIINAPALLTLTSGELGKKCERITPCWDDKIHIVCYEEVLLSYSVFVEVFPNFPKYIYNCTIYIIDILQTTRPRAARNGYIGYTLYIIVVIIVVWCFQVQMTNSLRGTLYPRNDCPPGETL